MKTNRLFNLGSNSACSFLLKGRGREGLVGAMKSSQPAPSLALSLCAAFAASIQMWKLVLTDAAALRSPGF